MAQPSPSAKPPQPPHSHSVSSYLTSLFSLEGKTALITGATRGLGRQIALALASAGSDLIILARDPQASTVQSLSQEISALGRHILVLEADLQNRTSYLNCIETLITSPSSTAQFPSIFIHSAGLQHRSPSLTFPTSQWDAILEVNLTSGFLISQALAKHWLSLLPPAPASATSSPPSSYPTGSHKTIVLLASVLSRGPGSQNIPAYVSSKGGMAQLVKGLSNEWAKYGVNVNAVAPGYFATELTSGIRGEQEREMLGRVPVGRWGRGREDGEEMVEGEGKEAGMRMGDLEGTVVWLCGRGAEFVSGETVVVDGGFSGR